MPVTFGRCAAVLLLVLSATAASAQPAPESVSPAPSPCEIRVSDEEYRAGLGRWCETGLVSQLSAAFGAEAIVFQIAFSQKAQALWATMSETLAESFRAGAAQVAREEKKDITLVLRDFDARPLITCRASRAEPDAASCVSAGPAALSDNGCRVLVADESLRAASSLWCDTGFFRDINARTDATFGNVLTVLAKFSATGQARWLENREAVFTRVREGFAQFQQSAGAGKVNMMVVFYANDTSVALGRCAQLPAQKNVVCELAPPSLK